MVKIVARCKKRRMEMFKKGTTIHMCNECSYIEKNFDWDNGDVNVKVTIFAVG